MRELSLVVLATAAVACNYASRSLIPILSPAVCDELRICISAGLVSESTSAFFLGDLVAQFSAAWLVKRVSGPWLLATTTIGWTLATVLIPLALRSSFALPLHTFLQLSRGLLCGFGYPSAHAIAAASPSGATALGFINAAGGIGMMLANFLVPQLLRRHAWDTAFAVIGMVTLPMAVMLAVASARLGVRLLKLPEGCGCAPQESSWAALVHGIGSDYWLWMQQPLVRAVITWMVVTAVGVQTVGGAFLPSFFMDRHGVSLTDLGGYTGAPPLVQVGVCLSVGVACDMLVSRAGYSATSVRWGAQLVASAIPALCLLLLAPLESSPATAAVLVTVWHGCTSFHSAGAMAVLHAVGRGRAGELFVLGNGFAKLGALLSTTVIRGLLDTLGWPPVLLCIAAAYAASGAMLLPRMANAKHIDRAAAFVAGESTAASPDMDGDARRRKDE